GALSLPCGVPLLEIAGGKKGEMRSLGVKNGRGRARPAVGRANTGSKRVQRRTSGGVEKWMVESVCLSGHRKRPIRHFFDPYLHVERAVGALNWMLEQERQTSPPGTVWACPQAPRFFGHVLSACDRHIRLRNLTTGEIIPAEGLGL